MTEAYWSINSLKIYQGSPPSGKSFCAPKPGTSSQRLGYDIDYACGHVSCSDIPSNCQSLEDKTTWAISKFYAYGKGTCDFSGSAHYVPASEVANRGCLYGADYHMDVSLWEAVVPSWALNLAWERLLRAESA